MTASDQQSGVVYLATKWYPHSSPEEYNAFETREAAKDWIESDGGDLSTAETYGVPGDKHTTFQGEDRYKYSLRELEVRSE